MKEKLLQIINHFGRKAQRDKLCEEFRELQDELYRYIIIQDEAELLTEIADVFVLCLQFFYDYGYDEDDLIQEMNNKIDRTIKRIKEGYYEKK